MDAKELASVRTEDYLQRDTSFHVFADLVVSEHRTVNMETAHVAPLTSEKLLVCDVLAAFPVHV